MVKDMRISIFLSLLISLNVWADNQQDHIDQAKPVILSFAKALKAELNSAMQAGGPVAGIEACNIKAPSITEQSNTQGWEVNRTSQKWRNPNNQPDAWEQQQLVMFKKEISEGVDPSTLWAVQEDSKSIRVMKAIPTQPICLACHGENMSSRVQEILRERYPNDLATGFKAGELRGAFSLKRYKF